MKVLVIAILLTVATSMSGCARIWGPGSGQLATVRLNDGSTFGGTITSSSSSSITIRAANGETRIIPTSQVQSLEYGKAAPATPATSHPAN